jgi:hypothetical protein
MNLYRILTAVMAATATTEGRPSEPFIKSTVQLDNTAQRKALEKELGMPVALSGGGTPLNYPILKADATYDLALQFLEAKAAGKEMLVMIEGKRVIAKVPAHYVINPTTGKKALDEKGNPRTKDEIMFFCPAEASETTITRQLTRKLDFVAIEGAKEAEGADVLS